jgi:putative aldouronate transport system permease protein
LSGVDPNLYEASSIDGATRIQQVWHITLPHLYPVIIIVLVMYLSKILNVFQSVFVLYNPLVYEVSDVIGTYVYRKGFIGADYDYATAVGVFRSLISLVLVLAANQISKRLRGVSIF